jgi:hypothetical protein
VQPYGEANLISECNDGSYSGRYAFNLSVLGGGAINQISYSIWCKIACIIDQVEPTFRIEAKLYRDIKNIYGTVNVRVSKHYKYKTNAKSSELTQ